MYDSIKATIDLNAFNNNIKNIRDKIGSNLKLLGVLKADAYGHGAVQIARCLKTLGIDYFGVATLNEALELYINDIKKNILIFSILSKKDKNIAIDHDFKITAGDENDFLDIIEIAKKKNKKIYIHCKVDTGMGRLGLCPKEATRILEKYSASKYIVIEGIYSHFPASDIKDKTYSIEQLKRFKAFIIQLEKIGIKPKYIHMANSGAILDIKDSYFNMVRPGIIMYGYYPSNYTTKSIKIRPIMTLSTKIMFVKRMKKNNYVSYGLTYMLKEDSYIASIRAGYADGYSRALSNKGKVLINNKEYPIVGTICMDQTLINLGDDYYKPGERVVLFGPEKITADTLANLTGTISYEVLCNVSKRAPRLYRDRKNEK